MRTFKRAGPASHLGRLRALLFAALLVLLPVTALAVTAVLTDGAIEWSAIGGGAQSAGGSYTLSGAAGQAGAHTSLATGGGYSLNGGYVPRGVSAPPAQQAKIYLPVVSKP